jgi:carbon monoxide dehydrogenase subunit G
MAITMDGKVLLPATKSQVWEHLNNPDVLKKCIPGCERLERKGGNTLSATAKMKIGPISAKFNGSVSFSDIDPPNGYKITGEGEGGLAGFAKGNAIVKLSEEEGRTLLTYVVEVQIGGKIAQLGQRLITGTAKKLSDQFFLNFANVVSQGQT